MTRLTRYSEAFWGLEFTSTAGFEALSQRMRDGKTMCKDFEDYLKQRYDMEKSYCKDLQKLHRNMKTREEIGVLEKAWNKLREEVETIVQIHHDASSHFQRQMEDVKKFNETQTGKRKLTEEHLKRYQTNKNNNYNSCMKSQKNYKEKCRDKDNANDTFQSMKSSVTTLAKDLDKATKAKAKSEDDANKAELMYKSSIDSLESARLNWEKEMQEACETFQKLDEDRIRFLRECLWVSVNIDSQVAVDIDNCCESVRGVLENCEVEKDISTFIQRHQTGTERPAPISFENYYTNVDVTRGHVQRSGGQRGTASRTLPTPQNGVSMLDDAGVYASLQGETPSNRHSFPVASSVSTMLVITRPHQAQTATELTVEPGQKVHFVKRMAGNGIQVRLDGTNKYGLIPNHCVQQFI